MSSPALSSWQAVEAYLTDRYGALWAFDVTALTIPPGDGRPAIGVRHRPLDGADWVEISSYVGSASQVRFGAALGESYERVVGHLCMFREAILFRHVLSLDGLTGDRLDHTIAEIARQSPELVRALATNANPNTNPFSFLGD